MRNLKKITKQTSAVGVKGMILDYGRTFRVSYGYPINEAGDWYKDYDILHPDMSVEIVDTDAYLYEDEEGNAYVDMGLVGDLYGVSCEPEMK